MPRDPDDEYLLNLALTLNAASLATWDNDLLSLMNDNAFTETHPALQIIDPATLLRAIRQIPQLP